MVTSEQEGKLLTDPLIGDPRFEAWLQAVSASRRDPEMDQFFEERDHDDISH